jgi:tRNA 2-thiouridine synthesizing protein A
VKVNTVKKLLLGTRLFRHAIKAAATCLNAIQIGLTYPYGYPGLPFAVIDEIRGLLKNPHNRFKTTQQRRHDMEFSKEFDASGLACPLPIVKTKKALADMTSGQVLRVISTDPGSVCDMAAFAEQTGNALLEQGSENSKFVFYLKKA